MTQVSVCIRTHDRPDQLVQTIQSALAQTFVDFEILVSDDSGSSEAIVRGWPDPRVRYTRAPSGAGATGNLCHVLRHARGELLALLDDDDRWHADYLQSLVRVFSEDRSLGVVFSDCYLVTTGSRPVRRRAFLPPGRQGDFLSILLAQLPVTTSAAMLRRDVWLQIEAERPLALSGLGATAVWLRAAEYGWPFFYLPEPLVQYAIHPGQITRSVATANAEIALLQGSCFVSPEHERLRRRRLARARLLRSSDLLRAGSPRRAIYEMRRAQRDVGSLSAFVQVAVRTTLERVALRHPRILWTLRGLRHPSEWVRLRRPEVRDSRDRAAGSGVTN